jgi:hypothetical protein
VLRVGQVDAVELGQRHDGHGHVDPEDRSPGPELGQVGTGDRADRREQARDDEEHREALAALLRWERVEDQDGRRWDQQAAPEPLEDAEHDQPGLRDTRVGHQAAHQRADREDDDSDDDDPAMAEDVSEPPAERDEGGG